MVPIILVGLLVAGTAVGGGYLVFRLGSKFQRGLALATPTPVTVGLVAQYPGASVEEVERQIAIPLEVALAGMPRLRSTRSRSCFGVAHLSVQFEAGTDLDRARQHVVERLLAVTLPDGVNPKLLPASSGAILRYTLSSPKDALGKSVYSLHDLRALQEQVLYREFRRVAGVADVIGAGGTIKRYEIHVDPDRLRRFGITLAQLHKAVARSDEPRVLLASGRDPFLKALAMKTPRAAVDHLRAEEERRLREIRQILGGTVNNVPIRVGDLVEGGPLRPGDGPGCQGVIVGHRLRCNRVALSRRLPGAGAAAWADEEDVVQGTVLLRWGENPQEVLAAVRGKIEELNAPSRLLPGVRIEPIAEDTATVAIDAAFPSGLAFEEVSRRMSSARRLVCEYPEVAGVVSQVGLSGDLGQEGPNRGQLLVTLAPEENWPVPAGHDERRTRIELMREIETELRRKLVGIDWTIAQVPLDDLWEAFDAGEEHLVKIFGPDLEQLQRLATEVRKALLETAGVGHARILHLVGRENLTMRVDPERCARWGVRVADVNRVIQTGFDGLVCAQVVEGDTTVDVTLRWPERLRGKVEDLLDCPIEGEEGPAGVPPLQARPRLRLRDCGTPLRERTSVIYRENGKRLIAVRFSVEDRDPTPVIEEVEPRIELLLQAPYRLEWATR
jgi:Cu/Ag efflux pump CusA